MSDYMAHELAVARQAALGASLRADRAEALLAQARELLERSQHLPEESYAAAEHCEQWDHDARALLAAISEVIR